MVRLQEGTLVFTCASDVHHEAETILEIRHVDRMRVRDVRVPAYDHSARLSETPC